MKAEQVTGEYLRIFNVVNHQTSPYSTAELSHFCARREHVTWELYVIDDIRHRSAKRLQRIPRRRIP